MKNTKIYKYKILPFISLNKAVSVWESFEYYRDYLEYNIEHMKEFSYEHLPQYITEKLYFDDQQFKSRIVLDITKSLVIPHSLPSGDYYNLPWFPQCVMPTQKLFATHFRKIIIIKNIKY